MHRLSLVVGRVVLGAVGHKHFRTFTVLAHLAHQTLILDAYMKRRVSINVLQHHIYA